MIYAFEFLSDSWSTLYDGTLRAHVSGIIGKGLLPRRDKDDLEPCVQPS